MQEYIKIGKINVQILKKINIELVTDDVIFTFERMKHVECRRQGLFDEVKDITENKKLNIIIKMAIKNDKKHTKNSIITMMKIGEKTFRKIYCIKN